MHNSTSRSALAISCLRCSLIVLSFNQYICQGQYTQEPPADAAYYSIGDPNNFDLTDFNNYLYSTPSKYVVVPAGTYRANPSIADNFGHWNLHDMVIDMRDVTLTLTNPTSISYWDVESNLTIVGLTLWTNQELWTQGVITNTNTNSDGSVTVTVQTDTAYDHSIWFDGTLPIQPLRYMSGGMVAISGCQSLNGNGYTDQGGNKVSFSVGPSGDCPASQFSTGMRFAKGSTATWPQIIQEYSSIEWIDVTSNLFYDSYGGSTITYTNCKLVNGPAPAGSSVRRSAPAYVRVQGWGYPATGSWYYLGYDQNGQDAKPTLVGSAVQNSADPNDVSSWW